jgi:Domain of unknown function (DUF4332)
MAMVSAEELSGIAAQVAARLRKLGIHSTEDLLRANRRRLADELPGVTVVEVQAWQQVAELLEVRGMTLAQAEGLHANGVETLDELANVSLSAFQALVARMRADGVAVGSPTDDQLVEWAKDAVLLRCTGTLNGSVVGLGGGPIRGVSVSCLGIDGRTDARGRFRLRRLPLGRAARVALSHASYVSRTFEARNVVPSGVLAGETFQLTRKKKAAVTVAPMVLSELAGDVVPPVEGASFTERVQTTAPSRADLLVVNQLLEGGSVRAVSRLFDFDGTLHIVRAYRLPATQVRGSVAVGDHLRFIDGKWKAVDLGPKDVARYRRKLQEQRSWRHLPKNPSAADVDRGLRDWFIARTSQRQGGS